MRQRPRKRGTETQKEVKGTEEESRPVEGTEGKRAERDKAVRAGEVVVGAEETESENVREQV